MDDRTGRVRRHTIISGTGRAGTTVLVQLLAALGFDTGFPDPDAAVLPHCHAGLERDLRDPAAPYVVKDPRLCLYLDDVLRGGGVAVDLAIVPIRELFAAAESRRSVTARAGAAWGGGEVPGGLWDATPETQERVLQARFYQLLDTLTRHDVPTVLLHFPRLVDDPAYLYRKLQPLLGDVPRDRFGQAFVRVMRRELVHAFTP